MQFITYKATVEIAVRIKSMSVKNLWILVEMEGDVKLWNLDTNVIVDQASQVVKKSFLIY